MALLEVRGHMLRINKGGLGEIVTLKKDDCFTKDGTGPYKVTGFNENEIMYVPLLANGSWRTFPSSLKTSSEANRQSIKTIEIASCVSGGRRKSRKSKKARKTRRRITKQR